MRTTKSFLIDTGILIRHLRADVRASVLLNHLTGLGLIAISAVSVFEIYRGDMNEREDALARRLVEDMSCLATNVDVALAAAEIARSYPGILRSDRAAADALIAGTAFAEGSTLVTLNTRQFSRLNVPGLRLLLIDQQAQDWAAQVP